MITTKELAEKLNVTEKTVYNHKMKLGLKTDKKFTFDEAQAIECSIIGKTATFASDNEKLKLRIETLKKKYNIQADTVNQAVEQLLKNLNFVQDKMATLMGEIDNHIEVQGTIMVHSKNGANVRNPMLAEFELLNKQHNLIIKSLKEIAELSGEELDISDFSDLKPKL
jgi:hypothetical protein